MVVDDPEEIIALTLTFVVHVMGAFLLIWAMLEPGEGKRRFRDWWPGNGGPPDDPEGPDRGPDGPRPLPLPDTEPSSVRLRTPGRAADGYPRPTRRPADHPPERAPTRSPS